MKIKNEDGIWVPYKGLDDNKHQELSQLVTTCLKAKPYVIIALTGNKGVGKSSLGKYFRRKGFGSYKPREIAVIDDDNMAVDFLFFFRRWHAIACQEIDELRPFFRFCRQKPIRFYIKSNPESRITHADILLKIYTDESKRRQRLIRRYGEKRGTQVFRQSQSYEARPAISFQYELEAKIE